jgi:hyperosmotically inducible protein
MTHHFRKLALAAGVALAVASSTAFGAALPGSQDVIDARHETQIWTTYALNPHLRANDLQVSVRQGKATLSGNVEEGVNKELAEEIALGVTGVKAVENNIKVATDFVAPDTSLSRTYGETIDDSTITAVVKSKLAWSKYTNGLTTKVVTKSGRVTLTGSADSAESRDLAGRLAQNSRGVVAVDNQLLVGNAKPSLAADAEQSMHEAGHEVADAWITTKVKSTFLYSNNVDGSDIAVTTSAGVVSLTGKVDSGVERALAIELAKNIRGVRSVTASGLVI